MIYYHEKPNGERFTIEFKHCDYPSIFERSFDNQVFLSQDVKAWLVKNNIKVFVEHKHEKENVIYSIRFQSPQDASEFMDEYAKFGQE